MEDVITWFRSWPAAASLPRLEQPVTVSQWFEIWPGLRSFLRRLVAAGIDKQDPDVQLWWAVVTNDTELLQVAIQNGANIEITDSQIMSRYAAFL